MHIKYRSTWKGKTYLRWLISYAIIFIVPVIIGLFFYIQSVNTIKTQVEKVNKATMEQLALLIDAKMEELGKICTAISIDNKTRSLSFIRGAFTPEDYYLKSLLQMDLIKYSISNGYIKDIYLVLGHADSLVSQNLFLEGTGIERYLSAQIGPVTSGWLNKIRLIRVPEHIIVKTADNDEISAANILYVHPIGPMGASSQPAAHLVILVDQSQFQQLLSDNELTNPGSIAIFDMRGTFFDFSGSNFFRQFSRDLNEGDVLSYHRINGEDQLVIQLKSDLTGWRLLSALPTSHYLSSVQNTRNLILGYVALTLSIGLALVLIMVKKTYRPLEELINQHLSGINKPVRAGMDEFSFLEDSLKGLVAERDVYLHKLEVQSSLVRQNSFARVLKGHALDSNDLKEACGTCGIEMSCDSIAIMLIDVEEAGKAREVLDDQDETINLLAFLIENVLNELLSHEGRGYAGVIDGMIACLITFKPITAFSDKSPSVSNNHDTEQTANQILAFFGQSFGILISVAVSEAHEKFDEVSFAYAEAKEAIEYKTLMDIKHTVIHYRTLANSASETADANSIMNLERQFIDMFHQGDFHNAITLLNDIVDKQLLQGQLSLKRAKYRVFGLINALVNLVDGLKDVVDTDYFDALDPVARLLDAATVTDLKTEAQLIIQSISDYFEDKAARKWPDKIREILQYIEKIYFNPDLSVASIANHFDLDVSYFHRIFKKHTGVGALEYIHRIRIDRAKDLMNTDLTIKEIADRVGFYNSLAMIRVFKKIEGVTPGRYREGLQNTHGDDNDVV